MRDAAANADVGDDVYGEDATVNTLENISAEMFNKESALFLTSGTQGNAVAVLAHTQRGDEIILEARSHIYGGEVGGLAVLGSLMARTVYGERGWMKPEDLEAAIRPDNIHLPHTSLICVENTHNASGGTPLTPKQVHDNWEVAKNNNLGLHIDGARIFNASIAFRR
jgi:threonine aldolase